MKINKPIKTTWKVTAISICGARQLLQGSLTYRQARALAKEYNETIDFILFIPEREPLNDT